MGGFVEKVNVGCDVAAGYDRQMQPWVGTLVLVALFITGVGGVIWTEAAQRKYPNTGYGKHSGKATAGFMTLAVLSAFALFR